MRRIDRARRLREDATPAEKVLWRQVRGRALGVRFRRQHPIGPFIVDFAATSVRLAVELDGEGHYRGDGDVARDARLRRMGIRVFHVENRVVLEQVDDVLAELRWLVANPTAAPTRAYE